MKKNLYIILIVMTVISLATLYDFYRSKQVYIQVVNISPEKIIADSSQEVTIAVKLTNKKGKPIPNHNLYALTLGGGSWKSYREKSDKNGDATFIYYPYNVPSYQTVKDVTVKIRDESNSVFVEIYPTKEIVLKMNAQSSQKEDEMTVDDFLD